MYNVNAWTGLDTLLLYVSFFVVAGGLLRITDAWEYWRYYARRSSKARVVVTLSPALLLVGIGMLWFAIWHHYSLSQSVKEKFFVLESVAKDARWSGDVSTLHGVRLVGTKATEPVYLPIADECEDYVLQRWLRLQPGDVLGPLPERIKDLPPLVDRTKWKD